MFSNKIRFCAWNIHGYNSRLIGNKFCDQEFRKNFENADLVGVTETFMYTELIDKINIPNFHRVKVLNQAKNCKSNTASKGIAVFVREKYQGVF